MAWKVNYTPPPKDLSRLNAVQRYMQKGSLERQDYIALGLLVLVYWILRPYIQRTIKWLAGPEFSEGETEQKEYLERRQRAKVGSNSIRSGKTNSEFGNAKTLGDLLDEGPDALTSGRSNEKEGDAQGGEGVKNRKEKTKKGVTFSPEKSEQEKLMDWDDEPARRVAEGDQGDVMEWLDKWDK